MSNQFNEFDEVFRDRLREHAVSPPDSVWEEISAKRNYGHVVANRISKYWRTFGTLLLLLLAGGSSALLIGGDEESLAVQAPNENTQFNNIKEKESINNPFNLATQLNIEEKSTENTSNNQSLKSSTNKQQETAAIEQANSKSIQKENKIPDAELMASMEAAAFSRPELEDPLLNIYISHLDGWESAKPISFIRYDEMNKSTSRGFYNPIESAEPIRAGEIEYEYAFPTVDKRTFKERSSLYLAITPQQISKYMTPEFDVSSEYLRQRAESETPRMAYTLTAALHYELKNHKFIETGVNFTQIYEEMHYEGEKRFSNQYDFIEIPLLLGYEARNSKWGWQIKGGFGVQVYNNYKGYILKVVENETTPPPATPEPDEPLYRMRKNDAIVNIVTNNHELSENQERHTVANLENESENPFKTSGVINLHLAAGVTYYHSIRTTFVLSPHYSRSINSITNRDARFQERINYMGVTFGGRFNF